MIEIFIAEIVHHAVNATLKKLLSLDYKCVIKLFNNILK